MVWMVPYGQGSVPGHRCEWTRSGGTVPARHRAAETVPVSVGRDGAVRRPSIRRSRRRATHVDAWRRSAATYEADARSLQPTVLTTPEGSISRAGSVPQ